MLWTTILSAFFTDLVVKAPCYTSRIQKAARLALQHFEENNAGFYRQQLVGGLRSCFTDILESESKQAMAFDMVG